jgi:hypothetical protein
VTGGRKRRQRRNRLSLSNDRTCLTADGIEAFARHDEASKRKRS